MNKIQIHKRALLASIVIALIFLATHEAHAQIGNRIDSKPEVMKELDAGDKIWSGTASFNRNKNYVGTSQGNYRENISMFLGADVEYLNMLNPDWGVGGKAFLETFFAQNFESATLLYVGLGPVLRRYVWQKNKIQTYAQLNVLIGYDMALGESNGGSGNSEFRYRSGFRIGSTYRLSNSAGLFLNIGPDWEGDDGGFDAQGLKLEAGIQLFRF